MPLLCVLSRMLTSFGNGLERVLGVACQRCSQSAKIADLIAFDSPIPTCVCLQCGRPGFDPLVGKIPWRRKWQHIPGLLPGKFHGRRSLVGYSPWGRKESDTTKRLHFLSVGAVLNRQKYLHIAFDSSIRTWSCQDWGELLFCFFFKKWFFNLWNEECCSPSSVFFFFD